MDLRLKEPKKYRFDFQLGTPLLPESGFDFAAFAPRDVPEVDFRGFRVPRHLSQEMMSHFPKAKSKDSLALDLGCGRTSHREACRHAGFDYVGVDYSSVEAPILADAHALPFKDESFDFLLSIAVLEHIRFPFVALAEAYRVLKPGGRFLGNVAFLEPFHGDSFYHHTHLGTYNSLQEAGFTIERVAPMGKYPVLIAQARMALFPKMPNLLSKSLAMPLQLLHVLWWKMGSLVSAKSSSDNRIKRTTASFTFIATKEAR